MSRSKRRNKNAESQAPSTTTSASSANSPSLSTSKKLVFAFVASLLFFGVAELLLFLAGIRPRTSEGDPYVGFTSRIPLFIESNSSNGMMVTAENKLPWFNRQEFARQKNANTFRIFCLGGSTTYGRPYNDSTSFCGWLREFLPQADSSRNWEVINAGGISYASYRVALVIEELAAYDPDLILVYTGHNEFLEDRTYGSMRTERGIVAGLNGLLSSSRLYSAASSLVSKQSGNLPASADSLLPGEVKTKLDQGVGPDAFTRNDEQTAKILSHFELNLRRIVELSRDAGAKAVLITPASNLRHCSPFKSEVSPALDSVAKQQLFDALALTDDALANHDFEAALAHSEKALLVDSRYAHAHYQRGKCLDALGRHREAKAALQQARDEDVCALRALTQVRSIMLKVAEEKSVGLVDFHKLIDERALNEIPGEDWFLDHVHPTVEGNRILALSIVETLIADSVVQPGNDWDDNAIQTITARVEAGIDKEMQGSALRNLAKVLRWAGKREDANRMAEKASELLNNDVNTAYLAANALIDAGELDSAITKLKQVIASVPEHAAAHTSLGVAYHKQGNMTEAESQYLSALQIDPAHTSALNNLASYYLHSGQLKKAEPLLRQAIKLRPSYAKGHYNLGSLLIKQRKWSEAIDSLKEALVINHDLAPAHSDLGAVYETQRNYALAIYHYRQALRVDNDLLQTANSLAMLLATNRDDNLRSPSEAVRWALQAAEGTSYKNPGVFNTLAAAYAANGDFEKAVHWQQQALRAAPPSLQAMCRERIKLFEAGTALHQRKTNSK